MNEEKTILVTGGSGYIGSVTCKLLVDSGYNVINIDKQKRELEGVSQYPFDIDNHQLIGKGRDISEYFNFKLKEKFQDHPQIGDVRGIGLLSAIELVKDKKNRKFFEKQGQLSQEIVTRMAKNGVLARAMPAGDTIGFAPAFCISNDEIDIILDVTLQSVNEVVNN